MPLQDMELHFWECICSCTYICTGTFMLEVEETVVLVSLSSCSTFVCSEVRCVRRLSTSSCTVQEV